MKKFSLKIRMITPLFSYGAHNKDHPQPEIRVASIRGMLRWWANALLLPKDVSDVFGGEQDKSPVASRVRVRLRVLQQTQVQNNLLPHPSRIPLRRLLLVLELSLNSSFLNA